MLSLEGNPLVLTKNYTKIVTERVKDLKVLDGNTVFADEEEPAIGNKFNLSKKKTMTISVMQHLKMVVEVKVALEDLVEQISQIFLKIFLETLVAEEEAQEDEVLIIEGRT